MYMCQTGSNKDLLICPQHQILLLGFFGQTRLFTKHACRQLISWFQIPSHPSRTQRRWEFTAEWWRRRRRGWGRSWRRRGSLRIKGSQILLKTLGATHGKHIQVLGSGYNMQFKRSNIYLSGGFWTRATRKRGCMQSMCNIFSHTRLEGHNPRVIDHRTISSPDQFLNILLFDVNLH